MADFYTSIFISLSYCNTSAVIAVIAKCSEFGVTFSLFLSTLGTKVANSESETFVLSALTNSLLFTLALTYFLRVLICDDSSAIADSNDYKSMDYSLRKRLCDFSLRIDVFALSVRISLNFKVNYNKQTNFNTKLFKVRKQRNNENEMKNEFRTANSKRGKRK